jgi:hypothetical protein
MNALKQNSGFSLVSVMVSFSMVGALSLLILRQQKLMLDIKTSNEVSMDITKLSYQVEKTLLNPKFCSDLLNNTGITPGELEPFERGRVIKELGSNDFLDFNSSTTSYDFLLGVNQELSKLARVNSIGFEFGNASEADPHNFIYLVIGIEKGIVSNGQWSQKVLGGQYKQLRIPLGYRVFGDQLTCQSGGGLNEIGCNNPGEFITHIDEQGNPVCRRPEVAEQENWDLEDFDGGSVTDGGWQTNDSATCRHLSISSGFGFKKVNSFLSSKEKYSLLCSENLSFSKNKINEDGEEQTFNYEFKGLDPDLNFETQVEGNQWAHCPEGQVIANITIHDSGETQIKCKKIVFGSDSDTSCEQSYLDSIESQMIALNTEILAIRIEIEEIRRQNGRDLASGESSTANLEQDIVRKNNQIRRLRNDKEQCFSRYISKSETKSQILTANSGESKKCESGQFLTGVYVAKKKKDGFRMKCSQLSAGKQKKT